MKYSNEDITIIDKEIINRNDYSEKQEMRVFYMLKNTPDEIKDIYYFGIPDEDNKIIEHILKINKKK